MTRNPTIVLCSGEMSGDLHAAHVVAAIKQRFPKTRVLAMGGERCAEAGAEILFNYRDFAILGFSGVLANLPRLWRLERALKRAIDSADLFVAVDYPGLNLRLAAHARRRGVPVLYYISPQLWAWGAGRMDQIAKNVDRMAVILPFEEALYREHNIAAEFVGHPFVVDHELPPPLPQDERTEIGLLPGSREQEVRRILPALLGAAGQLHGEDGFTIARSPGVSVSVYDDIIAGAGVPVTLDGDAVDVMRRSRLMLVASGTATLQGALMETPLVIVYRVSALNYFLARRLIRIPNIGLVNVVLGDRVAPELVQHQATPAAIARAGRLLLDDADARHAMVSRFRTLRDTLAGGGGCERVAEMAGELMQK